MKDFKSYTQDGDGEKRAADGGNADGSAEIVKILSQAVRGKSEGQILRQIMDEAERGKRAGTLTNDDLDNFYAAVAPMLDGFKRQKLKQVITKLKSI